MMSNLMSTSRELILAALDLFIDLLLLLGEGDRKIRPTQRISLGKHKPRLYKRQGGKCRYCGIRRRKTGLQVDHVEPVVMGGSNAYENLQLLCPPCNQRKGFQSDAEFRQRHKSLLPADQRIPREPIAQERFRAVTKRTTESQRIKQFRKSKYLSPRERITGGATVTAGAVFVVLLLALSSAGLSGVGLLILPVLVAGPIWGGIYLRASHTDKLVEPGA